MNNRYFAELYKIYLILAFLVLPNYYSIAQNKINQGKSDPILINNADNMKVVTSETDFLRYLNGNVKVFHANSYFFCDTAILKNNTLYAFGNVSMLQGDSLKIFGDTLYYNGDSLKAKLIGKVLLKNNDKEIVTKILNYDVKNKIATYDTGARMKQKKSILSSKRGIYNINADIMYFYGNVTIKDPEFNLRTDSIMYDSKNRIAYYIAPTYIDQDSSKIYCEGGFYDIKNRNAEFRKNIKYVKGTVNALSDKLEYFEAIDMYILSGHARYAEKDKIASADTIRRDNKTKVNTLIGNARYKDKDQEAEGEILIYNEKTESFISVGRSTIKDGSINVTADNTFYNSKSKLGYAKGKVVFIDTSSRIILYSAFSDFNKSADYLLSYGDSTTLLRLISYSESDTTYISADTLEKMRMISGTDTTTQIRLFNNVRIYNKGYQAIADSLMQYSKDSLFVLYNNPFLWSEDTQISGDTISIWMKKGGIEKLFARDNGFINNLIALNLYNQIKGTEINAFFENDTIKTMIINGNAEAIYHMEDEKKALTGTVKTVSSSIDFDFKNNKIKNIKFHGDPTSDLIPIRKEVLNPQKLSGFNWMGDYRPRDKDDISPVKIKILPLNTDKKEENIKKSNKE
ncbi:MAG: LPS export ABC transporter periplasmic protein LptC [Saprospiraceae bacterium]|nr:LPS export ABC transporter periplasmic protein LptC [Saprospiraceae bacterium]